MSAYVACRAYAYGVAPYPEGISAFAAITATPTGWHLTQRAYRCTNRDRMTIIAVTVGIRSCPRGSSVDLYLDNRRVFDVIAAGKLEQWRLDGWRARVGRRPIKDADLWRKLDEDLIDRQVTVVMADHHDDAFADCVRRARVALASPVKHIDPPYRRRPVSQPTPSKPKARPSRILIDGDPCPRCQMPVTRVSVKGQSRKPGQRFYWAWILRCEACGARYQTREGRRQIDSEFSPPAITQKAI